MNGPTPLPPQCFNRRCGQILSPRVNQTNIWNFSFAGLFRLPRCHVATSTFSTFHFNIFNISFQHFVHGYIVLPALENDIYIFPGITNSNSSPRTIRFENENENGSCACSHDQYSESPWRYFYRFQQTRISIHAQDLEISSCYFNVSQKKRKPCVTLGNVTKHCDIRIVIFIIVMKDEHFFCWHPQS